EYTPANATAMAINRERTLMTQSLRQALVAFAGAALLASASPAARAQAPGPAAPTVINPWAVLTPFPEPAEELLGVTAGGKLLHLLRSCLHGLQRQNLCVRRFQAADDRRPFLGSDRQFLGIRPRGGFLEGAGANADQARRGRRGRRQWQNLRGRRSQLAA